MVNEKTNVERAIRALQTLGDVSRSRAERLLSSWSHVQGLTDEERAQVLDAFGPAEEYIDCVSRCRDCHRQIEHVAGIPDPYWRHLGDGFTHPARPAVTR